VLDVGCQAGGNGVLIIGHKSGGVVVQRKVVSAALEGGALLGRELWQVWDAVTHGCRIISQVDRVCVDSQHKVQVALGCLLQQRDALSMHASN
jgi:hypothetical protein